MGDTYGKNAKALSKLKIDTLRCLQRGLKGPFGAAQTVSMVWTGLLTYVWIAAEKTVEDAGVKDVKANKDLQEIDSEIHAAGMSQEVAKKILLDLDERMKKYK